MKDFIRKGDSKAFIKYICPEVKAGIIQAIALNGYRSYKMANQIFTNDTIVKVIFPEGAKIFIRNRTLAAIVKQLLSISDIDGTKPFKKSAL